MRPRRSIFGRRKAWLAVYAVILAVGAALLVSNLSPSPSTAQSRAADAAASYARQYMVWSHGPSVQSTHVVRLRQLDQAMAVYAPAGPRRDVNVGDLVRRYGPDKQVALVILTGTFNSLPPDEGVSINGGVVAIVDGKTDRVLLLTD